MTFTHNNNSARTSFLAPRRTGTEGAAFGVFILAAGAFHVLFISALVGEPKPKSHSHVASVEHVSVVAAR